MNPQRPSASQTDRIFKAENLKEEKGQPCPKIKLKTLKSRSFKDEPISKYLYFENFTESRSNENRLLNSKAISLDSEPVITRQRTTDDPLPENPFLKARRSLMEKEKEKLIFKLKKGESVGSQEAEEVLLEDRVTFRTIQKSQPFSLSNH